MTAHTCSTPLSLFNVDVARRALVTSMYTEPPAPMSSATAPDATSLPLSITTALVQICSTSLSRWLDRSTVVPRSDTRRNS